MPVYEYRCDDCKYKFDIVATLAEKEKGLIPACPKCGGRNVRQIFGRFTVVGRSKGTDDFEEGFEDREDYGEDLSDFDEDLGDEYDYDEDMGDNDGDTGESDDVDIEEKLRG